MEINKQKILEKSLQIRYFEERLLEEYKKGLIHGTVHTCIGQEIFPCILAEFTKEYFWFSNHRGHGHYIAKTGDFRGLAAEIMLKKSAVAAGIGGSQHLKNTNFISNGIQGGQTGIATGYSSQLFNKEGKYASVMFLGDGTLGAGHIYEAFNLSGIYNSKIIFVLEDNKIAQSTPSSRTFNGNIKEIVEGYNINYVSCDSNNYDSMLEAAQNVVKNSKKPYFIHLHTQRLSSHSKSDDNRKKEDIEVLKNNDILNMYLDNGNLNYDSDYIKIIKSLFDDVINSDSIQYNQPLSDKTELDVSTVYPNNTHRLSEHINDSLSKFMKNNKNSLIIGEDIEDDPFKSGKTYGGAFKVTKGLSTKFPERILSMPISESGFTGFGTGLSLRNQYVIIEIMFADFLSQNFDQIFHQITKIPTIYGSYINLPVLIRTAGFAGNGYGPTHSSSMENIFFGLPNLDIFVPNLFFDYTNILNYFQKFKKPMIVIEPKTLYTKKMSPEIYSEYKIQNVDYATVVEPINRKPKCTIFAYGPEFDLIVSNLEYLAKEYEIYVNIFSPVNISSVSTTLFTKLLNKSDENLINLNQSALNSNIGNHWIAEVLKTQNIMYYNTNEITDWIPTGRSEKEVLITREEIAQMLENLND
tara:strand:- start:5185 stop:7098 length:1914 start_codon:yes stop_codon:yes gene_type:complete